MIKHKPLVLDANVIMRAVLGVRVGELIQASLNGVFFYAPAIAVEDVHRHLPAVVLKRGMNLRQAEGRLREFEAFVEVVEEASYAIHEQAAHERIDHRDSADWPIVATALLLDAPIWTEDQDFFGCGVATWITATVAQYFRS